MKKTILLFLISLTVFSCAGTGTTRIPAGSEPMIDEVEAARRKEREPLKAR
jgi:hypothetical protein